MLWLGPAVQVPRSAGEQHEARRVCARLCQAPLPGDGEEMVVPNQSLQTGEAPILPPLQACRVWEQSE